MLNVRVPPETLERIDWLCDEKGTSRADVIRRALAYAARDARPPVTYDKREVGASSGEWQSWREAAIKVGQPLDEWIRSVLNGVARRVVR